LSGNDRQEDENRQLL